MKKRVRKREAQDLSFDLQAARAFLDAAMECLRVETPNLDRFAIALRCVQKHLVQAELALFHNEYERKVLSIELNAEKAKKAIEKGKTKWTPEEVRAVKEKELVFGHKQHVQRASKILKISPQHIDRILKRPR